MDRLKRKELEQLKLEKEMKNIEHKNALKNMIKGSESIQIALRYAQEYLTAHPVQNLSQYSPTHISRLVFDQQLQEIKQQFMNLPDEEAHIEQFMIVMLKVMKFPFEKSPLYLVGLKEMFYDIAQEGQDSIKYNNVFKYILGQLVTMKEEEHNTQFQVRLTERKKQDYLLHDNGIKQVYYSKDLKMVFSLDYRSNSVKFYDQDMKNIAKFSPKKDKHNNRYPSILDFDYSQITERLGVVLSDQTLSIVHLPHLLTKTEAQFDSYANNEVVFALPEKMKKIFFVQMMNRWLTVSEEGNRLFLFDMDRFRSQPDKVKTRLKINLNDQPFETILEVVQLSCICVVAGNEISFYNETFSEMKFKKFVHCDTIKHFRYSDEKNQFYLCGLEKNITAFSISRNGTPSKIWNFQTNKVIYDFELFPYFDTIVVIDENHDVKLMHEATRVVYQQLSYAHIVKEKDKTINILKVSKNEFIIFQTYMIVMTQEKIAIERDVEYSFLPYYHYDQNKQEMYMSVNHQIISFNLMSGQIRKNYSLETSNLEKHHCMFIESKCPLFILDYDTSIYEVYQNDELADGENKSYRKKINVENIVKCFYDSSLGTFIVVSKDSINQVRNDKNNNFTSLNTISLEGFGNITQGCFCQQSKILTLMTADQLIYQFQNFTYHIQRCYRFTFPKDSIDHEDRYVMGFHYDYLYDIFVVLSNKSELYFIERRRGGNQVYFNIINNMPSKLKDLKFIAFKYQLIKTNKNIPEPYILAHDQSGFFVQFSLAQTFERHKILVKNDDYSIKTMFKDNQTMVNQNITVIDIVLSQKDLLKKGYEEIGLLKAHDKQIAIALKVKVQIIATLTIAVDGYIKLWSSKNVLLFSLKIPSLLKITWNMKQIEQIKNKKSIKELLRIFDRHYKQALEQHATPLQMCSKSKQLKYKSQIPNVDIKYPIKVDIENKDIEDIVMKKQDYRTFYSKDSKHKTHGFFHTTSKIYPHPWRKKKQFVQIYQKASPSHKYKVKIPDSLVQMRNSLDMTERVRPKPNLQQAEKILPQLSFYEHERGFSQRKKPEKTIQNEQEEQTFESCLYIKTQKRRKKINELDEIDKEFKKKEMMMTARKFVPKKRKDKNASVGEIKFEGIGSTGEGKADPIKAIQRIFEEHNRQALERNKGRLIRIPKITLHREMF